MVAPRFEDMRAPSAGLAAVMVGEKWGYLDRKGTMVVPPRFEHVTDFAGGLAAAQEGGKYGFIDKTGAWVVPPRFDVVGPIAAAGPIPVNIGGKTPVAFGPDTDDIHYGGKWGYVDRSGEWVIKPRFDAVRGVMVGLVGNVMQHGPEQLTAASAPRVGQFVREGQDRLGGPGKADLLRWDVCLFGGQMDHPPDDVVAQQDRSQFTSNGSGRRTKLVAAASTYIFSYSTSR